MTSSKSNKRAAGILLPLFSLPSPEGRGCLDSNAFKFIDWLVETKQSYWQMLPIGPTFRYHNPYSAYSSFGGDPNFISLQRLQQQGLIQIAPDHWPRNKSQYIINNLIFHKKQQQHFNLFLDQNTYWIKDFAVFSMLSHQYGFNWSQWPDKIKNYHNCDINQLFQQKEAQAIAKLQWIFYNQWNDLHLYANEKGIQLIGDIPIYVDRHSIDIWPHTNLFKLNKNGEPRFVSGAPPDQFSPQGQIWNTPVFDWDAHQQEDFSWWKRRLHYITDLFDIVRIDHFRGLEAYWEIPNSTSPDARNGKWVKAKGDELFAILLPDQKLKLIVEDLGDIDDNVRNLRDKYNLPGMKILQFAFDGKKDNEYLDTHIPYNSIVYTGTHDNNSIMGWLEENKNNSTVLNALKQFANIAPRGDFNWQMIKYAFATKAHTVVIPMADILGLGSEARINIPGTIKDNWKWQFSWKQLSPQTTTKLRKITHEYHRSPI